VYYRLTQLGFAIVGPTPRAFLVGQTFFLAFIFYGITHVILHSARCDNSGADVPAKALQAPDFALAGERGPDLRPVEPATSSTHCLSGTT